VRAAGHAAALGQAPAAYERRTINLFEEYPNNP
jgi:hypothetical protein